MASTNRRMECAFCSRMFRSKSAIEQHIDSIHPEAEIVHTDRVEEQIRVSDQSEVAYELPADEWVRFENRLETFVSVPQNIDEEDITIDVQDCSNDQSTTELQVEIATADSKIQIEFPDGVDSKLNWEKEQDIILLQLLNE